MRFLIGFFAVLIGFLPLTVFSAPPSFLWDDPTFTSGVDLWTISYPAGTPNDTTVGYTGSNQYGYSSAYLMGTEQGNGAESTMVALLSSFVDISSPDYLYNWTEALLGAYVSSTVDTDYEYEFCMGLTTADTLDDILNISSGEWIYNPIAGWEQLDGSVSSLCIGNWSYNGNSGGMYNFTTNDFTDIPNFTLAPVRAYFIFDRTDTNVLDSPPYFYINNLTGLSASSPPEPLTPTSTTSTATYYLQTYNNHLVWFGIGFSILALAKVWGDMISYVYKRFKRDTRI